jgi:hypothetical protein
MVNVISDWLLIVEGRLVIDRAIGGAESPIDHQ